MIADHEYKLLSSSWNRASEEIGFSMETPFYFCLDGEEKKAFAYLKEYGSENGMVLGLTKSPEYDLDQAIIEWANENNCYYSFLNIDSANSYTTNGILDCLLDWGKFKV